MISNERIRALKDALNGSLRALFLEVVGRLDSAERAIKITQHIGDSWTEQVGLGNNEYKEIEYEVTAEDAVQAAHKHFDKIDKSPIVFDDSDEVPF